MNKQNLKPIKKDCQHKWINWILIKQTKHKIHKRRMCLLCWLLENKYEKI